jgi:tRNA(Ile)-lysidine synthase
VFETYLARLVAALARIIPEANAETKYAIAASGGPDSVALLLLCHAAFPDRIIVATVDHGLRTEAAQEAAFVASVCAERGIPHFILRPIHPITGNLQSSARTARYALLHDWASAQNASWIMTAHHGDDQLETLLMRIIRGSGVDGLASIRARNGNILRPLLDFSKAELEGICAAHNIAPVRDPSNDSDDFDRVRLRKWLADSAHPFTNAAANRSACALAQSSEALGWMASQIIKKHVRISDEGLTLDPEGLPREMLRRVLIHILQQLSPDYVARGDAVERCLDSLQAGFKITIGTTLCQGGKVWRFTPAPPRRNG